MKILFISLDHFPSSGACSSLLRKLSLQTCFANAADIHVLTPRYSFDESATEQYQNVTVHRFWYWQKISKRDLSSNFFASPNAAFTGGICKIEGKIVRKFFKGIFADPTMVNSIYRSLLDLASEKFDVIIPVAGLYESVKGALKYAGRSQTHVVVYQVDPCSTNQAFAPQSKQKRLDFELKMYEKSDAVITTPIILREMQSILPKDLLKKAVPMEFPNVDPQHTAGSETQKECGGSYNCVFAGGLYKKARNPGYTFQLFSALDKENICLHMVGVSKETLSEFEEIKEIPENVKLHGIVPLDLAQEFMEKADILVNIGNIMTNQVPSKIFEYISSGKPIVNICVSHDCPTLPYLEKYPYVLNLFECDGDFENQVCMLKEFISENAGKRVSAEYITREYETCTAQYCAQQMLDIINQTIINERPEEI